MNAIGLDIGTTTICAAAIDAQSGEMLSRITLPNSYSAKCAAYERCQNPDDILALCVEAVDSLIERHSPICSIGITGQMHGMVYLDKNGAPVSSLYTWQDMSADEAASAEGGESYAEQLSRSSGCKMASGFGCSTYYVHSQKACVPNGAAKICTIHDYAAMRLAGLKTPVMHASDAASFGLFDSSRLEFDRSAVEKAGLDFSLLPQVCSEARIIGKYKNIPVCIAIGDNQASFIGSVRDMDGSVLVNIGTGSQISFLTHDTGAVASTELRPLHGDAFLRVGSALCGGRAFAALEAFIRETSRLCGCESENAYPFIDSYLQHNPQPDNPLEVSTAFTGTRDNPALRGSIGNLSLDNFTPGHLIYGVLNGIVRELLDMYSACERQNHGCVIGSGNGLRKNAALQRIISEVFDLPLRVPRHKEEAAFGAALYSLTACGEFDSLEQAQQLIKYD